jgi:hypothetical protein
MVKAMVLAVLATAVFRATVFATAILCFLVVLVVLIVLVVLFHFSFLLILKSKTNAFETVI